VSAAGLVPFLRRQRALVLTLSAACLLLGAITLPRLGTGIYPEVEFPRIVVVARAGDSPPELMEPSVVRPLEAELATVMGVRLTGFPAWWVRRTYYLMQMPRWDRRLRMVLDWTVALFFRPDITKVDLAVEQDQVLRAPSGTS